MSDYSLRPPHSPSMGAIGQISQRSSSPGPPGGNNQNNNNSNKTGNLAGRYSLGKISSSNLSAEYGSGGGGAQMGINSRSPSLGNVGQLPGTPLSARGIRPSSEMLHNAQQGSQEASAIDKWFEDLQHYEATLEEMAAASLDQSFKEELTAIESWFRVLSEAERTAALYSLLQESTQVQIRFFITVLQQMARSDPVSALLSPGGASPSMMDQMDARLASMGLKSPAVGKMPASPFHRQSSDGGFLSPNAAAMYGDAASALAAQRAKLKANRTSAPGTLTGGGGGDASRGFSGSLDQVEEQRSASPNPIGDSRPKSTDGLSNMRTAPRASGPLDDQLSPMPASWASMMNTPMAAMFDDNAKNGGGESNVNLEAAAAQLASLAQGQNPSIPLLDQDVSKFKRKSSQSQQAGGSNQQQGQQGGYDAGGASPNLAANMAAAWNNAAQTEYLRNMASPNSATFGGGAGGGFNMPVSPNALAGLQSPTGGLANPMNLQMMNAMASMGGLSNAQQMAMYQQVVQQQLQIQQQQQAMAALAAGGGGHSQQQQGGMNTQRMGRQAFGAGPFGNALSPGLPPSAGGRRSPRPNNASALPGGRGLPGAPASATAGGNQEDEVPDMATLKDVPAWLRKMRLHKYKPNFEHTPWREMVVMDDKKLEEMGVAALGARRKLLKTFELVRERYDIPHPPGSMSAAAGGGGDGEGEEDGKEGGAAE